MQNFYHKVKSISHTGTHTHADLLRLPSLSLTHISYSLSLSCYAFALDVPMKEVIRLQFNNK